MKALLATCVALLLTLSPLHAQADAWVIVPGKGLGPIAIGMPWADADKLLSEPSVAENGPRGEWYYTYDKHGITLVVRGDGRIHRIDVYSDRYSTSSGIRTGLPLSLAEAVYGKSGTVMVETILIAPRHRFWWNGLAVTVDADERVRVIHVKRAP